MMPAIRSTCCQVLRPASILAVVCACAVTFATDSPASRPVPLIHQTDLFRPHGDPDDHFDLANVYALAQRGAVKLLGVLGDYPPPRRKGDPDIAAVAMLNHLTGLDAPLVVGMPQQPASRRDKMESLSTRDLVGVNWLLKTLRESPEPVVITVVGSCKDVALAARRDPGLFARKCRAIYLNAGSGAPDPQPDDRLEYNVALDPASYASIFDAPCPVVWLPCFERVTPPYVVMRHGTFYQFPMSGVLLHITPPMQRFFLSMLEQEPATDWLRSLRAPVEPEKLTAWGAKPRNMWCTAGFFHLAGLAVSADGSLVPAGHDGAESLYRFVPVQLECADDGRTHWRPGKSEPPRWKFEITDTARYAAAMTRALREIIRPLGAE